MGCRRDRGLGRGVFRRGRCGQDRPVAAVCRHRGVVDRDVDDSHVTRRFSRELVAEVLWTGGRRDDRAPGFGAPEGDRRRGRRESAAGAHWVAGAKMGGTAGGLPGLLRVAAAGRPLAATATEAPSRDPTTTAAATGGAANIFLPSRWTNIGRSLLSRAPSGLGLGHDRVDCPLTTGQLQSPAG